MNFLLNFIFVVCLGEILCESNKKGYRCDINILSVSRNDVIRTRDLFVPNEALYQAEPHSDMLLIDESIDYVSLQRYLV